MLDNLFRGIFDTDMTAVISVSGFNLCWHCFNSRYYFSSYVYVQNPLY